MSFPSEHSEIAVEVPDLILAIERHHDIWICYTDILP